MNALENLIPEHRAAQLWTLPQFASREMDSQFCIAIANAIREATAEAMEHGFGIIANAGGGDWSKESKDWQKAAVKFRERYHALLDGVRLSQERK